MHRSAALAFCLTILLTQANVPASSAQDDVAEEKEFQLGDLVEAFDPPTLAEIDRRAEWIAQPVLDSLEVMLKQQRAKRPSVSIVEALRLRNTSPEVNQTISRAMGRLPLRDDEVDWNATLNRHLNGSPRSFNPLLLSSSAEFDITGLTGFGLFNFDANLRSFAAKETVASWQTSKDRLYDKVVLRDDLTWSDGKPITAYDVEFSFQVIMSSRVPVPAMRSGTDQLRWVKAYDDRTLLFFHRRPLATNQWNMNFVVIPKHIYETSIEEDPTLSRSEYHLRFESRPVTGGAYTIESHVPDEEVVLVRRKEYFTHQGKQVRPRPYFKKIHFHTILNPDVALAALKAGQIDELQLTAEQWSVNTDDARFYDRNTKAYGLEWVYFYFGWNCKSPLFADRRVRQAMSYAFDYETMLKKIRHGQDEQCTGIFHKTSRWAPKKMPSPYKQDLTRARKLLKEAGWSDRDGDGVVERLIGDRLVDFEFSILVSSRADRIAICELLQDNLARIGVVCNVRPTEFSVLQQLSRDHKYQAIFAGWGTGTDPDTSDNLWHTGAGRNYGQYSNPKIDKLFDAARSEFDTTRRREMYGKIHRILWEDQPYTWLYFRNSYYGFSKNLRGYNFSPRGPYNYGPGAFSLWKPAER